MSSAVPLTVTALAVKIVAAALRKFPQFNVSLDMAAEDDRQEVRAHRRGRRHRSRSAGACDSRRRLQDAAAGVGRGRRAGGQSAQSQTHARRDAGRDVQHLESRGGIGGTNFTPLVNAPEVGILGISRARMEQNSTRTASSSRG